MSSQKILNALGVLALSVGIPLSASAQFDNGDNVIGLGVGLLGGYSVGWSGTGVTQSPAINAHFDHGMGDLGAGTWGLGGYVGYKTIGYKSNYVYYNYDFRYTYLVIGARGTWHYNEWHGKNWDTYGGVMLAYRAISYKDNTDYGAYGYLDNYSYNGSGMGFSGFVGARYFFSDKFGVYGELGYGLTWLQLGLSLKL